MVISTAFKFSAFTPQISQHLNVSLMFLVSNSKRPGIRYNALGDLTAAASLASHITTISRHYLTVYHHVRVFVSLNLPDDLTRHPLKSISGTFIF